MSAAIRLIVTAVLVIWGLVDAVWSARHAPTFVTGVVVFGISAFESLLAIAVFSVVWEWAESFIKRRKKLRAEPEPFPRLTQEQQKRAIEAVKRALEDKAK
jgi:hypothetical protein